MIACPWVLVIAEFVGVVKQCLPVPVFFLQEMLELAA